jgi:predicted nucleic acid-binding Zn ribbon protein
MTQKRQPRPIKELLKGAIEQISSGHRDSFTAEEIKKFWREAAGDEASRHSSPTRIRANKLIVSVDSPIWIYQLNIKRDQIEKRLNKLLQRKEPVTIQLRAGED